MTKLHESHLDLPLVSASPDVSPCEIREMTLADRRTDEDRIGEPFHRFQALKGTDLAAATSCFSQFKAGLLRRMDWEDAHLFPAFSERAGKSADTVAAAMRQEHEKIRELLTAIEQKLTRSDPATEVEERELEAVLSNHNHRETRVVYSALET